MPNKERLPPTGFFGFMGNVLRPELTTWLNRIHQMIY